MIYQKNVFVSCFAAILVFGSLTSGQNYHYSNGWLPGKRSSSDSCQFRPEFPNLLFRFIEDEVSRMLVDPTCINHMAALKNLIQIAEVGTK